MSIRHLISKKLLPVTLVTIWISLSEFLEYCNFWMDSRLCYDVDCDWRPECITE